MDRETEKSRKCKAQLSLQIRCCRHKLRFLMHIHVDLNVLNNILLNLRIMRNIILCAYVLESGGRLVGLVVMSYVLSTSNNLKGFRKESN